MGAYGNNNASVLFDSVNASNYGVFDISNSFLLAKLTVVALVITVNSAFVAVLLKNRNVLKWKRYAFVVHLTVANIVMGLCVVSLSSIYALNRSSVLIPLAMDAVLSGSLGANMLSYGGLLWIQYYAIRRPLRYKTSLTYKKIVAVMCSVWIVLIVYCVIKLNSVSPVGKRNIYIFQIVFVTVTLLLNTVVFIYILYVSIKYNTCTYTKSKNTELSNSSRCSMRKSVNVNGQKRHFARRYRFVITTGLSLILYWLTILPFWAYTFKLRIYDGSMVTYFEYPIFHITVIVYYSRAIFDPLIHVCREPKLLIMGKS